MAFFVDFALFFRTIDSLLRYGALENSDKNGLPTESLILDLSNKTPAIEFLNEDRPSHPARPSGELIQTLNFIIFMYQLQIFLSTKVFGLA